MLVTADIVMIEVAAYAVDVAVIVIVAGGVVGSVDPQRATHSICRLVMMGVL